MGTSGVESRVTKRLSRPKSCEGSQRFPAITLKALKCTDKMEMQLPPEIKCRHENIKQINTFRPQQTRSDSQDDACEGWFGFFFLFLKLWCRGGIWQHANFSPRTTNLGRGKNTRHFENQSSCTILSWRHFSAGGNALFKALFSTVVTWDLIKTGTICKIWSKAPSKRHTTGIYHYKK